MDRVFLDYYEAELTHIRGARRGIRRAASVDRAQPLARYGAVPGSLCGAAARRRRISRRAHPPQGRCRTVAFTRGVLDVLYPDLVAPAPAMGMAFLKPGQQVQTMPAGYLVKRGTRLVSSLQPGLSTRCTYTTGQDVTLWPITVSAVAHYQDRSSIAAAGIKQIDGVGGESALAHHDFPRRKGGAEGT